MTLTELADAARVDQEREQRLKEARQRVDDAVADYHRTRRLLARLEGREGSRRAAPEPAIQRARNDVFTARTELHAARRALLAALQ